MERTTQEYNRGHGQLNLSEPPSSIIGGQVCLRGYGMIHRNLSHLTEIFSLWLHLLQSQCVLEPHSLSS
jgi:hypothetical protein